MDPLITNAIDPALLRVLDKRGQEHKPGSQRKRPSAAEKPSAGENTADEDKSEPDPDVPKHKLDDLA